MSKSILAEFESRVEFDHFATDFFCFSAPDFSFSLSYVLFFVIVFFFLFIRVRKLQNIHNFLHECEKTVRVGAPGPTFHLYNNNFLRVQPDDKLVISANFVPFVCFVFVFTDFTR